MKRSILVGASSLMVFGISAVFAAGGLQLAPQTSIEKVSNGIAPGDTLVSGSIQLTGNYATFNQNREYVSGSDAAYIKGLKLTSNLWGEFTADLTFIDGGEDINTCGGSGNKSRILKLKSGQTAKSQYWGEYTLDATSYYCPFADNGGKMKLVFTSGKLGDITFDSSNGATNVTPSEVGGLTFNGMGILSGTKPSTSTAQNVAYLQGTTTKFEARTAVNKNIASLTMNQKVDTYSSLDVSDNLLYFKGNVTLGGKVSGKKTVIVEGGDVTISSNMSYDDPNSFLVLVVKAGNGKVGSITVKSNVTNIVGTFISDGPLLSEPSYRQLLIYGSIFTANTIGGSVDGKAECPYGTIEYNKTACTIDRAKVYDLARLRNFLPIPASMITSSEGCNDGSDKLVPTNGTTTALVNAWAGEKLCYVTDGANGKLNITDKTNPLVIEYNPMIKSSGMKILDMK